jgi:hypothetical protein
MRIPSFLLGVLSCLLVVLPAMTQQEERIVIGVPLQIGMSKDTAINRIAERGLTITENEGMWLVTEKNDRNEYDVVGTLKFANSRLSWASRRWISSTDAGAAKVVRNLYFVLKSFEDQDNTSCTIGTKNVENQDTDSKALLIRCGKRTAMLAVAAYKDQRPEASLDETIK